MISFLELHEGKMITLEWHLTASFDVDPQRGFTPLCPKELPVPEGHTIAKELNLQARFAKYRLVSKDCHPAEAPWMTKNPKEIMTPLEGDFPGLDVKWPPHCVAGTDGNRLIPGLPDEDNYDLVVEKGTDPLHHPYGACYHDLAEQKSTGVIEWLQRHAIDTVIIGGLAADFCVKNTVLQLCRAGFRVVVNRKACRGLAENSSSAAFDQMSSAGALLVDDSSELESA